MHAPMTRTGFCQPLHERGPAPQSHVALLFRMPNDIQQGLRVVFDCEVETPVPSHAPATCHSGTVVSGESEFVAAIAPQNQLGQSPVGRPRRKGGKCRVTAPKTNMVPSDPSSSPLSDRHARSQHGIQLSRDVTLLLPATAFGWLRIDAPEPICVL